MLTPLLALLSTSGYVSPTLMINSCSNQSMDSHPVD
jgi:hypothetical protein